MYTSKKNGQLILHFYPALKTVRKKCAVRDITSGIRQDVR